MTSATNLPPALSREATQALLTDYAALCLTAGPLSVQDGAIETKLFNGNLRFAWLVAGRFKQAGASLGYDHEDLFSEASQALLSAIRQYDPRVASDPDGKNSFSGWVSRLMHQRLVAFVRARDNSAPDPMRDAASFDAPLAADGEGSEATLHDMVADEGEAEALDVALSSSNVTALIDTLSDREATVLRLRYGLAGCQPHQLAEIAAILGVSKQRAQAIEKRALERLRVALGVQSVTIAAKAAA